MTVTNLFNCEHFFLPIRVDYLTSIVFHKDFAQNRTIILIGEMNLFITLSEKAGFSKEAISKIASCIVQLHTNARLFASVAEYIMNGNFAIYQKANPLDAEKDTLCSVAPELKKVILLVITTYASKETAWPKNKQPSTTAYLLNYSDPTRNMYGQKVVQAIPFCKS